MNSKIKFLAFSALICLAACNQSKPKISDEDGLAAFNADSLKLHVAELSHDSLQGRKPFTEGETKTIAYLQKQFKAAGLEPGNGDSYIQEVPMVNIQTTAAADMQVTTSKGSFKLKGFDDYVIWTDKITDKVSFENDEVVFAGYGVVAPE